MWLRPTTFVDVQKLQSKLSLEDSEGTTAKSEKTQTLQPQLSWEATTALGKFTVTNLDAETLLAAPVRGVKYALDAAKEKIGIKTFDRKDAEVLAKSGLLNGSQWEQSPSSDSKALARYSSELSKKRAVTGSLTFSIPGLDAYPLLSQSSGLVALSALVAIGVVGDPGTEVELIVQDVAEGAIRGVLGHEDWPERIYFSRRLEKFLLEVENSCGRGSFTMSAFTQIIPTLLQKLPPPLRELCATTRDAVVGFGIRPMQLKNIAEWAFTESGPQTLVLGDPVEILAASVVATCMKDTEIRRAVVNCSTKSIQSWGSNESSRGLAVFVGGSAQEAMGLLMTKKWSEPHIPEPTPKRLNIIPELALYCSAKNVLDVCVGYLQSQGIERSDAEGIVDALKKDVIVQFSRKVLVEVEEESGYLDIKPSNVSFHYEFDEVCNYDWKEWFATDIGDILTIIASQPTDHVQLGSRHYYGYAAKRLKQTSLSDMHKAEMDELGRRKVHTRGDSTISYVVAELAGMVYSLGMSLVMARIGVGTAVRCSLGRGFRDAYSQLSVPQGKRRVIARRVILGTLAALWLGMPNWASEWPHIALAIGNSKGSVVSAILADSSSLDEATTKFIVSTGVADLMVAEKPVVLCAGWKYNIGGDACHEVTGRRREAEPHNACQEMICLTMSLETRPTLANNIRSNVLAMTVVGYISCGAEWYDYVDLDLAFMVMSKSHSQRVCEGCPLNPAVNWLDERDFLKRLRGGGFSCACPKWDEKLVIPVHGEGLKQSFLSGLFGGRVKDTRYQGSACLAHAEGDIVLDGSNINTGIPSIPVQRL